MELTPDEIKKIIQKPRAGADIASALKFQAKHKLHVQGEGYEEWLKSFHSVESERTREKKQLLCRPKTPGVYEQVKKQYIKIFRAKGNVVNFNFKSGSEKTLKKEFVEHLRTCANGMSLKDFMQQIWHDSMFEEFNGYAAVELDTEENLEKTGATKARPIVVMYPLDCIHDVYQRGYNIEYIVLNKMIVVNGEEIKGYRVIDSKYDAVYYMEGEQLKINMINGKEDKFDMVFSKIPFFQISRYRKYPQNDFIKNAPISKSIDDADLYLSISDDHTISVKMHQHPIFFTKPAMCVPCNGTGSKYKKDGSVDGDCLTCRGKGQVSIFKTDIAQGYTLPHVESDDGETSAAQPPCGYVTPELESLAEQRVEMQEQKKAIERSALGVEGLLTVVEGGQKETATKAEMDLQPLFDTLNPYSSNAESCEEFLCNRMGEVMFEKKWLGAHIHYGRKYFLKSENDVMAELKSANEAGAPRGFIRELIEELYWIRFEGNPMARDRAILLLNLEPVPELNITSDITGLSGYLDEEKLFTKVNFNDYIERYEREVGPIVEYDPEGNFDVNALVIKIATKLNEYAKADQKSVSDRKTAEAEQKAKLNGNTGTVVKK